MNWPNPFDLHASAFPQSTMHSGKLGDSEGLSPPYFDQAGLSILRPPHIHYNAKQGKKKVNVVICTRKVIRDMPIFTLFSDVV